MDPLEAPSQLLNIFRAKNVLANAAIDKKQARGNRLIALVDAEKAARLRH